jgi:hypothetical protein
MGGGVGVLGQVQHLGSTGGRFINLAFGNILEGEGPSGQVFRVEGGGAVYSTAFRDFATGVIVGLRTDCALGNVVRWAGTAWICDAAGLGTVTQIAFGAGLTGGTITTNGNVAFDTAFGDARYALNGHNHDSSYLALTGGTLTGALAGTTASFTGGVTMASGNVTGNLTLGGSINGGFRVQTTAGAPNILGGFSGNSIPAGVRGAVLAGGGDPTCLGAANPANRVTDDFGVVGGGCGNQAGDNAAPTNTLVFATVSGGFSNTASGSFATVGGGFSNTASNNRATVGGGISNSATSTDSTIGGGSNNTASGSFATVPGGTLNVAAGQYSFAAGRRAKANDNGSFVWADSTDADATSNGADSFTVRASGGVRFRNGAGDYLTADGSGNLRANSIANLVGVNIGLRLDCASGNVLQWSGTEWICVSGGGTGSVTQVDTGTGLTGGPINTTGTISFDETYGDNRYVNAAGDTMSGVLNGTTASFSGGVMVQNLTITNGGINNSFFIQTTLTAPNIIAGVFGNQVPGLAVGATISGGGDVGPGACGGALTPFHVVTDDFGAIGGGCGNRAGNALGAANDAAYATVSGGFQNVAEGSASTVGGGAGNLASALTATVGGGQTNSAGAFGGTVAGGTQNNASGIRGTIGGGGSNTASGQSATVGGGASNLASGFAATVPGGHSNTAQGDFSFAAGRLAKANHTGAFVWADSTVASTFASTAANQFRVLATGGTFFVGGSVGDIRSEANDFAKFSLNQVNGGADQKKWQNYATTNALNFSALNDAESAETIWMGVGRGAGTAISHVVFPSGTVGIGSFGSAPSNILTVQQFSSTDPIADAWTTYSSRRFKTNVLPLVGALDLVEKLQGVTYNLRGGRGERNIGFIAEDVGAVIPEVVVYEQNGVDAQGLDYARLTAVLVEAIKEQQAQLRDQQTQMRTQQERIARSDEELRAENERLRRELAELRAAVAQLAAQSQQPK